MLGYLRILRFCCFCSSLLVWRLISSLSSWGIMDLGCRDVILDVGTPGSINSGGDVLGYLRYLRFCSFCLPLLKCRFTFEFSL